jgi:hypothetical protein
MHSHEALYNEYVTIEGPDAVGDFRVRAATGCVFMTRKQLVNLSLGINLVLVETASEEPNR